MCVQVVFAFELVVRLLAHAPRVDRFFYDGWNVFDFVIVASSLLPAAGSVASVARLARLLRALRVVSALPELRLIVATMLRSIPSLANVVVLLSLILYVYAVVGVSLQATPWAWVSYVSFGLVVVFLALDLGVFLREAHEVSMREATMIWLTCGIAFSGCVYAAYENHWPGLGLNTARYSTADAINAGASLIVSGEVQGAEAAKQYLVGYVVEKSLAMDNIFVIALIFSFFAVPAKY